MSGFVKIPRDLASLDLWDSLSPEAVKILLWLALARASYKERHAEVGGKIIHLGPGDCITSRDQISRHNKISERKVRTALAQLQRWGLATIKATSAGTRITLHISGAFSEQSAEGVQAFDQGNDPEATNERPTNVQRASSNNMSETEEEVKDALTDGAMGFELFWSVYPKKVCREAAITEWNKLTPNDELIGHILEAIRSWADSPEWKRDFGRYVPNPARWLCEKRWEDEAPAASNPMAHRRSISDQEDGYPW